MEDCFSPRRATAVEAAALSGLWPDLLDGEFPPPPSGCRFEVCAVLPGDDTPLMLADATLENVAERVAMVVGHCLSMTDFEVRVRPVG